MIRDADAKRFWAAAGCTVSDRAVATETDVAY